MDVLLGSIDVRDLLSTQDLDESSLLSAPDLRLLIDRLQTRSLHIKDKVRDYVVSHHRDFAGIFSRCSRAAAQADGVAATLSDALRLLSDHPVDLDIRDLAREITFKRRELEERREALVLVRTISGLVERLQSARRDLRAGRLVEASEALRNLKAALLVDEEVKSRGKEPAVYEFLRKEWTDCFDELQVVLAASIEEAVKFELENGRVKINCWSRIGDTRNVELHSVLKAMEIACVMDYGLAKVADLMIKHAINPAIRSESFNVFVELHQDSLEKPEAILNLVQSSEYQENLEGATIYSRLIKIIKFINKFICFENDIWMQCFGRLTWPRMSDLIINHFLSKVVPNDASNVAPFQKIMESTVEFESVLKKMMFISTTDISEERLSNFAHNVEVHFASKRRNEILAKARSILLQFDYVLSPENMSKCSLETTGVAKSSENVAELLFVPERCCVSKTVSQLMELVHETLKDACFSSTRVSKEFYNAARDVLLLYKAIVPIKLAKQLDCISQVAIVMHNNCYYLSQEILGLAFEYRGDFPGFLKNHAIFIDIASNFYQMSDTILENQVQLVGNSLREAIDEAYGFQNTHQPQQYESAKFSVDQVVFVLEKVHIMWEPLMPPSTYRGTICTLLDFFFSRVTKDMLLLDDIAAEETLQLQRLIYMILENLSSLFESLIADVNDKEQFLKNRAWVRLDEMIPSLGKFRKLADLFDMPLKAITTTWETNELINCGFTSSEVANFVKAIFTDSPLRKECLWRIENTNS